MQRRGNFVTPVRWRCLALASLVGCVGDDRSFDATGHGATGSDGKGSGGVLGDGGGSGCGAGQYQNASPTRDGSDVCMPVTVCGPMQYEVAPPTETSDRQCANLTVCGPDAYETGAPTATTDRQCTPLSECAAGFYMSAAATARSDRTCAPCPEGTFSDQPNRPACIEFTPCPEGERELEPGSATADRVCGACGGAATVDVTFTQEVDAQFHEDIRRCMQAALDAWLKRLVLPSDVRVELRVSTPNIPTASGASLAQPRLSNEDGRTIFEAGVAYELRTGEDPNGSDADAIINLGVNNLYGSRGAVFWFDPDPWERTAAIPRGSVDATSVCLHEMGHVLGFNGYIGSTWQLPRGYATNYDVRSIPSGNNIYFVGPLSDAIYGGGVPETSSSPVHLGNTRGAGADLDTDLMHGTPTKAEYRYYVSDVDWAILADLGMPVVGTPAAEANCRGDTLPRVIRGALELGPPVPLRE